MRLFNTCLLFISGTVLGMRDMEIDKSAKMNSLYKLVFQDPGQTMKTNNPMSNQKVVSAMKENKAMG